MHRPRSIASVRRFRIAALLLVSKFLLALVGVGFLIQSAVANDRSTTLVGAGMMGIIPVFVLAQWVVASRAGCPLCMTPVLAPKACMKHRRARTVLGSHRLRVALAILFKNRFRCPYCNEATTLEVRPMIHRDPALFSQFRN